jgi:hypothetical protein
MAAPTPDRLMLAGLVQAEHILRALHQHWPADACRDAHQILTRLHERPPNPELDPKIKE